MPPAFPHFTAPVPAGFPGALPALPCSTAEVLPHRQQRCPLPERLLGAERGLVRLPGSGQSRRTGARAVGSRGGRPACSAALQRRTARRQQHHRAPLCPEQPRWQRAQHTQTSPTAHQGEQRFSQAGRGNSAQEFARRRTFPRLSESRVTMSPRCASSAGTDPAPHGTLPATEGGHSRDSRACRVPAPFRYGRSGAGPRRPMAAGPVPRLTPAGGKTSTVREGRNLSRPKADGEMTGDSPCHPALGSGAPRAVPKRRHGRTLRAPDPVPPAATPGRTSLPASGTVPVATEAAAVPVPGERSRRRCQRHRSARLGSARPGLRPPPPCRSPAPS